MTLEEQIRKQLQVLPPEKQSEVLDFVVFLQHRQVQGARSAAPRRLRAHQAFGSWKLRGLEGLTYQQKLRAEWDRP